MSDALPPAKPVNRPALKFTLCPPQAESPTEPLRPEDIQPQTQNSDLAASVRGAKRKLENHTDQIELKRRDIEETSRKLRANDQDQVKTKAKLERQKAHIRDLQEEIAKCSHNVEQQERAIADIKARKLELEAKLASKELALKTATRQAALLDVEDWEVEHLASHHLFRPARRAASAWIHGFATVTEQRWVKSVLLSVLTDASEAQIIGLVTKLVPPEETVETATSSGASEIVMPQGSNADSDRWSKNLRRTSRQPKPSTNPAESSDEYDPEQHTKADQKTRRLKALRGLL